MDEDEMIERYFEGDNIYACPQCQLVGPKDSVCPSCEVELVRVEND